MKTRDDINPPTSAVAWSVSGAMVPIRGSELKPWLPSTWPNVSQQSDSDFLTNLSGIFRHGMLDELNNVFRDVTHANGSLEHRGHVLGVSMFCCLDAVSAFTDTTVPHAERVARFVTNYFPREFYAFANDIGPLYRNSLIHSCFLFEVAFTPDDEPIERDQNHIVTVGLRTFLKGLETAVDLFLDDIRSNRAKLQIARNRYDGLQKTARG
jgi:hypothetical protein